jgi:HK97 family phage portal protein
VLGEVLVARAFFAAGLHQARHQIPLVVAREDHRFLLRLAAVPRLVGLDLQMDEAPDDLQDAVKKAAQENKLALSLPAGHEIKQIGVDPDKAQLVELKKFLIEEYARIYSLPPTFLQDLSRATFSNTEQQDLHLVKHTIKRWVEQAEQEMNLKFFGKNNTTRYVEFNLDGLLRGDFKTRMDGYSTGIQNAIMTPNEARRQENRPDDPLGNALMIQGATVPLGEQPNQQPEVPAGDPDES